MSGRRAVTYARFSTELQSDRSIEDQQALCHAYATRNSLTVIADYADRARSGASIIGREGLIAMMEAARDRHFDVLVVEALDRISRDMEDLAALHKRLSFAGIDIVAVHEGKADTLTIGLRGLIGQMFREDNVHKVRRGMAGVVRDGRHAGGRAYGYRPIAGRPGELEIVETEAAIIRQIFEAYAAGESPRAIAGRLNAEGVPPPRGQRWNASTINGSRQRATGIIQNALYGGEIVWNRVRMVRDPETGRRVSRMNAEDEFQRAPAPHLKIIDDDIVRLARNRKLSRSTQQPRGRQSKRLLSGLLRCGACGGGMTSVGSDRVGHRVMCSTHRESGACENSARYYVEKIEAAVLRGLGHALADPELVRAYVEAYREERQRAAAHARNRRAGIERRIADAGSALARLVDAVADGMLTKEDVADRTAALRQQKREAEAELALAAEPTKVVELHPQAIRRFAENIQTLGDVLTARGQPDQAMIAQFRQLVESVVVSPRKAGEPYEVWPMGHLAALMGLSAELVVAEEGLEPPTRGL
ncbi:recombinase family protein [Kaistia dalseonensis]|uniref:recombinase family protein n=1 Tax=Kaistia dalseonensis TaxID=410840 RepID=UPI00224F147A|nr:recombinase family protein [Kaistia dalseonensis]MCX5495423.1 recombinase family protein [Kaistia dalseonensis]